MVLLEGIELSTSPLPKQADIVEMAEFGHILVSHPSHTYHFVAALSEFPRQLA
jgi:hypothetical protein